MQMMTATHRNASRKVYIYLIYLFDLFDITHNMSDYVCIDGYYYYLLIVHC